MKPSTRVIDRIIAGLIGVVLLAGGAWLLAYRFGQRTATAATHRISPQSIEHLPDQPWWPGVVGGAGAVLVLVTLWLLVRHLRQATSRTLAVREGHHSVDIGRVADAVTADLARHPLVQKARSRTTTELGGPLIRVSVTVPRGADVDELTAPAAAARRAVSEATDSRVGLQVLVSEDDRSPKSRVE